MVANQAHAERNSRFRRIANRGRYARIRYRHDNVRIHRVFLREQAPQPFPRFIDWTPEDHAVWPGKINMLENTKLVLLLRGKTNGFDPAARNSHHFARLDF